MTVLGCVGSGTPHSQLHPGRAASRSSLAEAREDAAEEVVEVVGVDAADAVDEEGRRTSSGDRGMSRDS